MGTIHCAPVQVQCAGGAQLVQQQLMKLRPDPGLGPVPHTPPADHSRDVEQILRQLVPADPGLEHEHDPGQRSPVIGRSAPGVPVPPGRTCRQQRLNSLPQRVRNKIPIMPTRVAGDPASTQELRSVHSEMTSYTVRATVPWIDMRPRR